MLGIVNDQVTHPVGFPTHHLSIGVEHQQRRGHQFSGVQRGRGGLWGGGTHRPTQQHHLLVGAEKTPGRDPFVAPGAAAERDEILRREPTLRGAHQQIPQLSRKGRQAQCGPQPRRPASAANHTLARQQLPDHHILIRAG
jgi:hypothetical protein